MDNTYDRFPQLFVAGEYFNVTLNDESYPSSTWAANYFIYDSEISESVTATPDGDGFIATFSTSFTGQFEPGNYKYQLQVSKPGEMIVLDGGACVIRANPANGPIDGRTHAEKTLEALNAVIENRATTDQQSYTIAGRSLSRMEITDLLQFRDRYQAMVDEERAKNKRGYFNKVKTRFVQS